MKKDKEKKKCWYRYRYRYKYKYILFLAFTLLFILVFASSICPTASAGLHGDGCPLNDTYNGTVRGGIYLKTVGSYGTSLDGTFYDVPDGRKITMLYFGIWEGSRGKTYDFTITINENQSDTYHIDDSAKLDPWCDAIDEPECHVSISGCGVNFVSFNATPYVVTGTNDVSISLVGDVYAYQTTLFVVYENESMPEIQYWVKEGHEYPDAGEDFYLYFDETVNTGKIYPGCIESLKYWTIGFPHCFADEEPPCGWPTLNGNCIDEYDYVYSYGVSGPAYEGKPPECYATILRWDNIPPDYITAPNNLFYYCSPGDLRLLVPVLMLQYYDSDLTVTNISAQTLYANYYNTINATVLNEVGNASSFNVTFYANDTEVGVQHISSLGSGESKVVSFTWKPTSEDVYELNVTADAEDIVLETNEANNTKIKNVIVEPAPIPIWRNPSSNVSSIPNGGLIELRAQGSAKQGLDYSVLWTDETGAWLNCNDYGSPMELSSTVSDSFTHTNDTDWDNQTRENLAVAAGDVKLLWTEAGGNIALSQPSYARSNDPYYSDGIAAGNDGVGSTYWSALFPAGYTYDWWYVDLGAITNVGKIIIRDIGFLGDDGHYDIQISNDASTWTTKIADKNTEGEVTFPNLDWSCRYVRFYANHSKGVGFAEFEVYEKTGYKSSGLLTSTATATGNPIVFVMPTWHSDEPTGTSLSVNVSVDDGATWKPATMGEELTWDYDTLNTNLKYKVLFETTDTTNTPVLHDISLNYKTKDAPKDTWVWSNFTWHNDSIPEGTTVAWKICYNDTVGQTTCTDVETFEVGAPGPAIELIREQANTTGLNQETTVRLVVWNTDSSVSNVTSLNLTEWIDQDWKVTDCGNCYENTSTYIKWTLGDLPKDNYTMVSYKIKVSASSEISTFKANCTYKYDGKTGSEEGSEFEVAVESGKAFFDFELDMNAFTTTIDRDVPEGTEKTVLYSVTNVGDAVPCDTVFIELQVNKTAWNVTCAYCDEFYNDTDCYYLKWNEEGSSWAVQQTKSYNFTVNSSQEGYYNFASNGTYDPPANGFEGQIIYYPGLLLEEIGVGNDVNGSDEPNASDVVPPTPIEENASLSPDDSATEQEEENANNATDTETEANEPEQEPEEPLIIPPLSENLKIIGKESFSANETPEFVIEIEQAFIDAVANVSDGKAKHFDQTFLKFDVQIQISVEGCEGIKNKNRVEVFVEELSSNKFKVTIPNNKTGTEEITLGTYKLVVVVGEQAVEHTFEWGMEPESEPTNITVSKLGDVVYDSTSTLTSTSKPVIIMFKDKSDAELIKQHGGEIKHKYGIIPAISASVPEKAIDALKNNPHVAYIERDYEVKAMENSLPWGVDRIDAELVWNGTEDGYDITNGRNAGSGINISIIDTGIDCNHPDLVDNYKGGYDFVNNDADPMDDNGHGTHCAGIIAAGDNDIGVIGVAPEASLYAVKVLNSNGSGYVSDVIAGIEWSVNNNMKIISMSLGSDSDSTALHEACDKVHNAGLLLVAAAGNSGNAGGAGDNVCYPARYESVIAVAATDINDNRASFSSTGPAVELAAPGVNIYSACWDDTYATIGGTSMACPHVTGTAALVWNAYPEYNNAEVRQRMQETAEELGAAGKDTWYGYGLVNASEAAPPAGSHNESPAVTTPRTYDNTTMEEKTVFERNDSMFINVSISDVKGASDLNTVLITILNTTSATIVNNDTMTQDTPITNGYVYNYSWMVPGDADSGTWTLKVYANDTLGNVGSASAQFVVNLTNATIPENKNITVDLIAMKKHFTLNKNPEFTFIVNCNLTEGESKTKANETDAGLSAFDFEVTSEETVKTAVYYKDELVDIAPEIKKIVEGNFSIKVPSRRAFRAGLYTLKVELVKDNVTYVEEQDFTWGVLAINTHKSIYLPGETAFIGIAVLDDEGHMVCDAAITLTIIDPDNKETVLSTDNGLIKVSPECCVYGVTNLPDYYTNYEVGGAGTYVMNLTAVTPDGTKSITDEFTVQSSVDFDAARDGPTRIYPPAPYVMNFIIKANKNYTGLIKEYVPASFDITPQEGLTVATAGDTKMLTWNKNLVKGEACNIYYEFDAPDISPYLFVLGELEIGDWKEARQWQIASDSPAEYLTNPSFTGGTTGWTLSVTTYDGTTYQDTAGSIKTITEVGRNEVATGTCEQTIGTDIGSSDTVKLILWWKKGYTSSVDAQDLKVQIAKPSAPDTWVDIWSNTQTGNIDWTSTGSLDVSSYFDETGQYKIRYYMYVASPNDKNAQVWAWIDNTSLDVVTGADTTPPASITNLQNTTYASTYINWSWTNPADADFNHTMVYINGNWEENVSSPLNYSNATGLSPNTNNTISTHTVDTSGNVNLTWVNHSAWTAPSAEKIWVTNIEVHFVRVKSAAAMDTTPPASITTLHNTTYAPTYINWSWTNPTDADFLHVMVYINGTFKENVFSSSDYYNATGFTANTQHTISTHTVDTSGNVNLTWVNHSAWTAPAPAGAPNVEIITITPDDDSPTSGVQINPVPNSTKTVTVTAVVSDPNGHENIQTVEVSNINPAPTQGSTATMSYVPGSGSGTTATYEGTFDMQFYDISTTYTVTVTATDTGSLTGSNSSSFEYQTCIALELDTSAIDFWPAGPGESSEVKGDTVFPNAFPTIKNSGNVKIDMKISGTDMTGTEGTITVDNLADDLLGGGYDALSPTATEHDELDLAAGASSTQRMDFKLDVPSGTAAGDYSGTVTLEAKMDD